MLTAATNFCEGQMSGGRNDYGNIDIGGRRNTVFATPASDTLIPTADTTLRKLLVAGEERNNLKRQVINLEEQVKLLNEVIKEQGGRDSLMAQYYTGQMTNLQEQLALCKEQVKVFEKMVRVERRKRFWTGAAGMASTIAMIYLSTKN